MPASLTMPDRTSATALAGPTGAAARTQSLLLVFATACSLGCDAVAGLGDRRVPFEDVAADSTIGDAIVELDADAGDSADAIGPPSTNPHEAVGLLWHPTRGACSATAVGPQTVLTAASCWPALAHGCLDWRSAVAGWQFWWVRADGTVVARYKVSSIAIEPHAAATLKACEGSASCVSAGEDGSVAFRRSHDIALAFIEREETIDPLAPKLTALVQPARVLTRMDAAIPGGGGVHASVAIEKIFVEGTSPVLPIVVAMTTSKTRATEAAFLTPGTDWNRGCEAAWTCGAAIVRRSDCPQFPDLASNPSYFSDQVVRLTGGAMKPTVATKDGGARGGAMFLDASMGIAGLSGEPVIAGVLSDVDTTATHSSHHAAYYAPTFAEDTGRWLDTRLLDFDADCIEDALDPQPIIAGGGCMDELEVTGWSAPEDLTALARFGTYGIGASPSGSPAIASDGLGRLYVAVRSTDGTIHVLRLRSGGWEDTWLDFSAPEEALSGPGVLALGEDHWSLYSTTWNRQVLEGEYASGTATWRFLSVGTADAAAPILVDGARWLITTSLDRKLEVGLVRSSGYTREWQSDDVSSRPAVITRAGGAEVYVRLGETESYSLLSTFFKSPVRWVEDFSVSRDLPSAPAAAYLLYEGADVFVVDVRGHLQTARFGVMLSRWTDLGGDYVGAPAAAISDGAIHVVVRTLDDRIIHRAYKP
jgi:hypothetical protein